MNWETVKGFCRRRTQQLRENFQGASKTEDGEFDATVAKAETVIGSVKRMGARMNAVSRNLLDTIQQYEGLHQDIASSSLGSTDFQDMGSKIQLASQDFRTKFAPLEGSFNECHELLQKYLMEASHLDEILEDRKSKILEFDFFRNKVAALKANPPADTSRIPRNEGRVLEWQHATAESTGRANKLLSHLIQSGEELLGKCTFVLTSEVARYYGELSKTSRLLFLGSSLTTEAQIAMNSAQQAVNNVAQRAQVAATQAITTAVVSNPAAVASVVTQGSRRYFAADDPFRAD